MTFIVSLVRLSFAALAIALLHGCASVAHFESQVPGGTLAVHGVEKTDLPRVETLASKATGQYEFMATSPSGTSMYGLLPLKVSGGKIVLSVLFFAPALFIGGFRDVYPFYQFDVDNRLVRYKEKEEDDWRLYQPTTAESNRAQATFAAASAAASH